jgi:hypothetical protein
MRNSAYRLLMQLKAASAMGSGSFLPPEPLPNSVKANQLEQQELTAQQGEANAGAGNEQLMQMQKAQEDAVNQLQQTQQQLAQVQGELQNSQAQAQQQQQAIQMQAQQEIQKAQMDAQYELQSEKIKNQQKLLSVQEKYMRSAGKAKPDQNHILGNQLKRVVKKVNNLKAANTSLAGIKSTGLMAGKALGRAAPFLGAALSGASAINNLSKGNYLSATVDALGGAASFIPVVGAPLAIGSTFLSSALENKPKTEQQANISDSASPSSVPGTEAGLHAFNSLLPVAPVPSQQPQQRWDAGLSPTERFTILNQAQKSGSAADTNQLYRPPVKQPEYPDISTLMKNPPPPGEYISSPIPIWQAGFKQHDFNIPKVRQQGYGPIGDFIKQLIFQVGMPMFGMRNPFQPDFSKLYGSLQNNEAYKLKAPQTFNYY